jgi:hypothetical protein
VIGSGDDDTNAHDLLHVLRLPPTTFELTGETRAVESMVTVAARQRSRAARWRRGTAGLTVLAIVGIAGAAAASPSFDAMTVPGFVRQVLTGDRDESVETRDATDEAATAGDAAVGDAAPVDTVQPASNVPSVVPSVGPAGDAGATLDPPRCANGDRRSADATTGSTVAEGADERPGCGRDDPAVDLPDAAAGEPDAPTDNGPTANPPAASANPATATPHANPNANPNASPEATPGPGSNAGSNAGGTEPPVPSDDVRTDKVPADPGAEADGRMAPTGDSARDGTRPDPSWSDPSWSDPPGSEPSG